MEPAATIIQRLGGASAVASLLDVARGRVYAWTWPKTRGGTDGRIPQRYHAPLLREARERGFNDITAELLVLGAADPAAETSHA